MSTAICLAVAATFSLSRSALIAPQIFVDAELGSTWFESDLPDRACLMQRRDAPPHAAGRDHPLTALAMFLPAQLMQRLGKSPLESFRWTAALHAGAWMGAFFLLLRRLGCLEIDAIVFCALGIASSAAMFGTAVPEHFTSGALTLLAPLGAVLRTDSGPPQAWRIILASAASLSGTITNWISGLLATAVSAAPVRAMLWSASALLLVVGLWAAQSAWFPNAAFFIDRGHVRDQSGSLFEPKPLEAIRVFALHSMVMPPVRMIPVERMIENLTIQSSPVSRDPVSRVALAAWIVLLAIGLRALVGGQAPRPFRIVLGGTLGAQLLLHSTYGEETFLNAMHFTPLLILMAACGTLGGRENSRSVSL